jgi:cellulose synthase/poly-beta-1,6-N-acetylglucosamine synthase-like glycosyltransferase
MPEQTDRGKQAQPAPLVSVIIPAFNAADHVGAALKSVFAQSFIDYEVILVNDGSPDTERLEQAIQPYILQITYLKQANRGPSGARNLGIRHARGEWIAFLDSDDAWLPQYLAEQFRFLRSDPALDMVYCDATLEGESGDAGKTFMQVCPSIGPVTFESVLVEQTQVLTSGTVVRRRSVAGVGFFDEDLRWSEDHDLWLRVIHVGGKVAYQRQSLLRRNVRPGSQGSAPGALYDGEMQSLKKLERTLDLPPHTRGLLAQRLRTIRAALALIEGKQLLLAGEPDKAYEALSRACDLAPTSKLRGALIGLRIAPGLTARGVRLWNRVQSRQIRKPGKS